MRSIKPNLKKRSVLLPPGCKDLADVINGKSKPMPVSSPMPASSYECGMVSLGSPRVNGQITAESVNVFEGSTKLGIMPLAEALELAKSKHVDLVELYSGKPPGCLLIDYGEFRHKREEFLKRWRELWGKGQ